MLQIPDRVWRTVEARTIEDYMSPELDLQDPPSVAKNLQADGYDLSNISPHALVKTERYATVAAAFILQTHELVTGTGRRAIFTRPLIDSSKQRDLFLIGNTPLDDLARDIKYTYLIKSRDLRRDPQSRFGFLLAEYRRYSEQDVAPTKNAHLGFVRNGGGLPDAVRTFFNKLQPAVGHYLEMHNDEGTPSVDIYHDLAVLGLSLATQHLAATPEASTMWDEIDTDHVRVVRRGDVYTALYKNGPLIRAPQHPDPTNTPPIELERPRLKCPAHAHIPSRIGSALEHAYRASINVAIDRAIV